MNRVVLIIGMIVVVGMCLIPPMETERYNAAADLFGQDSEEVNIEYRPVWSEPEDTGVTVARNSTLAANRLLLQIVLVSLLTGGVAYVVQPEDEE